MAFTFVGSANKNALGAGATSFTCPVPSGVQNGDFLVLECQGYCSAGATITAPSGWNVVQNTPGQPGGNYSVFFVAYRIAASEPASYTITTSATIYPIAIMCAYRGGATSGAYLGSAEITNASAVTTLPPPSYTPNSPSTSLFIYGFGGGAGSGSAGLTLPSPANLLAGSSVTITDTSDSNAYGMLACTSSTVPASATSTLAVYETNFVIELSAPTAVSTPLPSNPTPNIPPGFTPMSFQLKNRPYIPPTVQPPGLTQIATSTSVKNLQLPPEDKIQYLYDGSMIFGYWNGTAGQIAQITNPLTAPVTTNLITTLEDSISIWTDNTSGTSSDIWIASGSNDAYGGPASLHVRHGTYTAGGGFTWDASTAISGILQPNTVTTTICWTGTYVMVFWWDGIAGSDQIRYAYTSVKAATSGWTTGATFSESATWSTICQVVCRHSPALGATVVVYGANSYMHWAALPDASTPALANWSGRTTFDNYDDSEALHGGPCMVIDETSKAIHLVRAVTTNSGASWPGIIYWKGTYSGGTVSWAARVVVDAAASTTGPDSIGVAYDGAGVVWIVWTTNTNNGDLKYATLASPYTSASPGGVLIAGSQYSSPRFCHVPAVSPSQVGQYSQLPVLFTDITVAPYPLKLYTNLSISAPPGVTYPLAGSATADTLDANGALGALGVIAGTADADTLDANGTVSTKFAISGSSDGTASASGAVVANLVVSGTSFNVSSANAAFGLLGVLVGSSSAVSAASGVVTQTGAVTGLAASTSSASGSFGTLLVVGGTSAAASTASGAVTIVAATVWPAVGSAASAASASGVLGLQGTVVGSAIAASSAAGSVYDIAVISGSAASASVASGSIGLVNSVSGTGAAASVASASITLIGTAAGLSATVSSASGNAVLLSLVAGQSAAASSASGSVSRVTPVGGSSASVSSATGAAVIHAGAITYDVNGISAPVSSASGFAALLVVTTGSSSGVSSANGTLSLNGVLVGNAAAVSNATGSVVLAAAASGSSVSVSSGAGTVIRIGVISGTSVAISSGNGWLAGGPISGSSVAVVGASGSLVQRLALVGSGIALSQSSGDVTIVGKPPTIIAASATAISTAAAGIATLLATTGASLSASTAAGTVTGRLAVAGTATAISSAAGTIGMRAALTGTAANASAASGTLILKAVLVGLAVAASGGSGWVLPPFVAGSLPSRVTGGVLVVTPSGSLVILRTGASLVNVKSITAEVK